MSDDIIVTPSEQLKGLLAMMAAKQTIQERKEVILSDDAEGYLRLENYLDVMGVQGPLADMLLRRQAGGSLQRALAREDILLRLNMVTRPHEKDDYVNVADEALNVNIQSPPTGGIGVKETQNLAVEPD
jgi:hypothetical protein